MQTPVAWRRFITAALLLASALPSHAQAGPRPSILWAAARRSEVHSAGTVRLASTSRTDGLAIGAVVGGLVAGFLGHRMCQAYSALGDCWGQTLWWGAIGGMLGGLTGATAAGENE